MIAADGVTPEGHCRACTRPVDEIRATAAEKQVHRLTGWVVVRGILYTLTPCGCTYGWQPDRVDQVDQVDDVPPAPAAGRHRAPAPTRPALLRWLGWLRWDKETRRAGRKLD